MEASTLSVSQPLWKMQPKKIGILLWLLCGVPLIHALLLTITEPNTINALLVNLLRPVGVLGAMLVFVFSGLRAQDGARRWAWWCQAIAMVFSVAFSTLRITHIATPAIPFMKLLATMIYLLGLSTVALYLQGYSMQLGSIVRVFVGSSTIGFATFIFSVGVLPRLLPEWGTPPNSYIPFISLDAGILFANLVVGLRYGLDKPHIPILWLSLACLLIGDTIQGILIWRNAVDLYWIAMPVTTLHNILLSMAAYRDVTYISQSSEESSSLMPIREWLLWTSFPLMAVVATFLASSLIGNVPPIFLVSLAILAIIHEIWAALDYDRVFSNLHKAHEQVRATASTMEAFVARIVHDLAPPVQGLLSAVRDASWREDQHYLQHIVAGQVALLEAFVHQARAYIMARTVPLKRSKLDLLPICLSAVAAAQPRAEQRGVQIVQDILIESLTVLGDETAVRRILDNLLTNAVGISPPGGEVALSVTAPTPQQIEISVSDQGPGIPPEKQAQLFKPYTSLQFPSLEDHGRSPSPTGTGMGLGLAIVKELSLALGGECGVTSTPNAGSTFYVRLPIEPMASPLVPEREPA